MAYEEVQVERSMSGAFIAVVAASRCFVRDRRRWDGATRLQHRVAAT